MSDEMRRSPLSRWPTPAVRRVCGVCTPFKRRLSWRICLVTPPHASKCFPLLMKDILFPHRLSSVLAGLCPNCRKKTVPTNQIALHVSLRPNKCGQCKYVLIKHSKADFSGYFKVIISKMLWHQWQSLLIASVFGPHFSFSFKFHCL